MKNKELIELLQTFDADLEVIVSIKYTDEQFLTHKELVGLCKMIFTNTDGNVEMKDAITIEIDCDDD